MNNKCNQVLHMLWQNGVRGAVSLRWRRSFHLGWGGTSEGFVKEPQNDFWKMSRFFTYPCPLFLDFLLLFSSLLFCSPKMFSWMSYHWCNHCGWNLEDPFSPNPEEFISAPGLNVNRSLTENKVYKRLLRVDACKMSDQRDTLYL